MFNISDILSAVKLLERGAAMLSRLFSRKLRFEYELKHVDRRNRQAVILLMRNEELQTVDRAHTTLEHYQATPFGKQEGSVHVYAQYILTIHSFMPDEPAQNEWWFSGFNKVSRETGYTHRELLIAMRDLAEFYRPKKAMDKTLCLNSG